MTGEDPVAWSTEHFAIPMGLPDLYTLDALGPQISTGGGQLMSCRDAARFGQLVANRGRWQAHDPATGVRQPGAAPTQLISQAYAELMLVPSFPAVSSCYSLLTWVNSPAAPGGASCFAARWGCPKGNESVDRCLFGAMPSASTFAGLPAAHTVSYGG